MNQFVYQLEDSLYINLTNKCTNACTFCVRGTNTGIGGYNLWLDREPSAKDVLDAIDDPKKYKEIVFCGYGEPTMKLDVLKEIARELKKQDVKTRINTNGLANLYYGRNIVPELKGLIDTVSISLNAPTAEEYQEMCRSTFGIKAFDGMIEFASECKKYIPEVMMSVVDVMPAEDIEKCRQIVNKIGIKLRVRELIK